MNMSRGVSNEKSAQSLRETKVRKLDLNLASDLRRVGALQSKRLHVIRSNGKWVAFKSKGKRALASFDSKEEAVKFAAGKYEDKRITAYVVHNVDGTVENWVGSKDIL